METRYIKLHIVEHSPGYIYITSPDMPSLNLWGPPPEVISQIIPAIKTLYKLAHGIDVDVSFAPAPPSHGVTHSPVSEIPDGCILAAAA